MQHKIMAKNIYGIKKLFINKAIILILSPSATRTTEIFVSLDSKLEDHLFAKSRPRTRKLAFISVLFLLAFALMRSKMPPISMSSIEKIHKFQIEQSWKK